MPKAKRGYGLFGYVTDLIQDFRFAVRSHSRKPALGIAIITVLSISIGATTAVFSIVNSVLLRPFRIADHDRMVMIWETNPSKANYEVEVSYPNFVSWRERNHVFDKMATLPSVNLDLTLTGTGEPEQVQGTATTGNFFSMLGVDAAMGRTLQDSDDSPAADPVVVISDGLWKRRFHSDPQVLGKPLIVDGQVLNVVGVMPADFDFPRGIELWSPLQPESSSWTKDRSFRVLIAVGHLAPGVKFTEAQAEMDRVASNLGSDYQAEDGGYGIRLIPMDTAILGNARVGLWILFGAVLMVLFIACINVANLLLGRALARRKEMIIRLALGAGRMRLIRQLFAEGLLLSIVSGAVGLFLGEFALKYLITFAPADIPRLDTAAVDGKVVGFTIAASLLTVFIFGLAPAIQATKYDLNQSLKGVDGRGAGQGGRLRAMFVVSEIALAMILLVAAGLLVKSFVKLQSIDPGFKADNILSMRIPLSQTKYTTSNDRKLFFSRLLEKIEVLPGVESAGVVLMRPLSGTVGWDYPFTIEGQTQDQQQGNPYSNYEEISPGYFRTMGISLIRGREFTVDDRGDERRVAIVGESMAKRFWPNEDPVGKRLKFGEANSKSNWLTVVGVVRDVNYREWTASKPDIYVSYLQRSQYRADFVIRTKINPMTLVNSIKKEVYSLDKDQAVTQVTTMKELVDASLARARFNGFLLSIFSVVAICLAAMGIYSVVAYSVSQRTKEMGIRMALGARIADLVSSIIYQEMRPIVIGVGLGLAGTVVVTRAMTSLLYGVGKYDPVTFVSVIVLLTGTAVAACLIPALRAGKTDPMVVLRDD